MEDADEMIDYYLKVIQTDGIDNVSKLNCLLKITIIYMEEKNDLGNALKYGYMSAAMTRSPRPDTCCVLGDIYMSMGNRVWAEKWYESAIGNIPWEDERNGLKEWYMSSIPLLKLSYLYFTDGNYGKAKELNDAVLMTDPENEVALHNKAKIDDFIAERTIYNKKEDEKDEDK